MQKLMKRVVSQVPQPKEEEVLEDEIEKARSDTDYEGDINQKEKNMKHSLLYM